VLDLSSIPTINGTGASTKSLIISGKIGIKVRCQSKGNRREVRAS